MKLKTFLTILISLHLSGCSIKSLALRTTTDLFKDASPTFEEETDLVLAEDAIPANVKILEGLLKVDPHNEDLLLLVAKGYGGYVFSFLENKMEAYEDNKTVYEAYRKRGQELYRRARDYALRYLVDHFPQLSNSLNGNFDDFEKALKNFSQSDVPWLFWAAYNWGNLVNLSKDDPAVVSEISKAEALMRRVVELDETYFYGGAHLFLGVFYGSRPAMLGGDFKKSKYHFEKALEISGRKFLLTQYLYARFYAVQTQDEKLFTYLLRFVQKTKASVLPEQRLANEVAKVRAARALSKKESYF